MEFTDDTYWLKGPSVTGVLVVIAIALHGDSSLYELCRREAWTFPFCGSLCDTTSLAAVSFKMIIGSLPKIAVHRTSDLHKIVLALDCHVGISVSIFVNFISSGNELLSGYSTLE